MTLRVRITHEMPGYNKAAHVYLTDENGVKKPGEHHILLPAPQGQEPGPQQTVELYVYDTQCIAIVEGPIPEHVVGGAPT